MGGRRRSYQRVERKSDVLTVLLSICTTFTIISMKDKTTLSILTMLLPRKFATYEGRKQRMQFHVADLAARPLNFVATTTGGFPSATTTTAHSHLVQPLSRAS